MGESDEPLQDSEALVIENLEPRRNGFFVPRAGLSRLTGFAGDITHVSTLPPDNRNHHLVVVENGNLQVVTNTGTNSQIDTGWPLLGVIHPSIGGNSANSLYWVATKTFVGGPNADSYKITPSSTATVLGGSPPDGVWTENYGVYTFILDGGMFQYMIPRLQRFLPNLNWDSATGTWTYSSTGAGDVLWSTAISTTTSGDSLTMGNVSFHPGTYRVRVNALTAGTLKLHYDGVNIANISTTTSTPWTNTSLTLTGGSRKDLVFEAGSAIKFGMVEFYKISEEPDEPASSDDMPWKHDIFVFLPLYHENWGDNTDRDAGGGGWGFDALPPSYTRAYRVNRNQVGAKIAYTFPIYNPGDYALWIFATKDNDRGIVQIKVDGVVVDAVIDFYDPSSIAEGFEESATFTVNSIGMHVVELEVVGKNASSSDYYMYLGHLTLVRYS